LIGLGRTPVLFVLLVLTACSTMQPAGPEATSPQISPSWEERKATLEALRDWSLTGRVAINNGNQGWQASVAWQQQADSYTIELIGPFGQGQITVSGDARGVRLRDGNRLIDAEDADSLFERATGTRLPISGLYFWIRGIPDPAITSRLAFDQQGRPVRIEQSGWTIEIPNYIQVTRSPASVDLPNRINAQQDDLKVKIIIQQWQLAN
jgi:outer membrane lipoprotein LolB